MTCSPATRCACTRARSGCSSKACSSTSSPCRESRTCSSAARGCFSPPSPGRAGSGCSRWRSSIWRTRSRSTCPSRQAKQGRSDMPKYLSMGSYTVEGIKGVLKEGGTGRRKAVQAAIEAMGGKMEAYYFAFGESDVVVISDVPDNVTAAALAIGIGSTGTVSLKTTVLLTPEELDQATKKTIAFRAAGQ